MFEIEKSFSFEAGHRLKGHDGRCAASHGHSYVLKVAVRGEALCAQGPKQGMLVDFQQISDAVQPILKGFLDHAWLNDTLNTDSPTAERVALWVWQQLVPMVPGLWRVTVCETPTNVVSYYGQESAP